MNTSELTGAALDWAVAKCEGKFFAEAGEKFKPAYSPSTNWAQGGPLIEREKISTNSDYNGAHTDPWVAETYSGGTQLAGPTPLIAAMRCYVASKLGETVDIPEELL